MFSLTKKVREYRAEQKRHAQIAREIDDALTDRQFLHHHQRPLPDIDPAYRQEVIGAQRSFDIAIEKIEAKGLHQLHKIQERLGANAGY